MDTDYWDQFDIGSNLSTSNYWEKNAGTVIQSSQALGTINMQVSYRANFGTALTSNPAGLGNFFIGEGEGAFELFVNSDTVATLVNRVNSSDANVHMYYDPVSDRFVVRNKEAGSIGITLHESTSWDALTANQGTGNLLNAMGLAAISANYTAHNTANNSTYLNELMSVLQELVGILLLLQALQDAPTEDPSTSSTNGDRLSRVLGGPWSANLGIRRFE